MPAACLAGALNSRYLKSDAPEIAARMEFAKAAAANDSLYPTEDEDKHNLR